MATANQTLLMAIQLILSFAEFNVPKFKKSSRCRLKIALEVHRVVPVVEEKNVHLLLL